MQARYRTAFPIMGTTASVHVNDNIASDLWDSVVDEIRRELSRLEEMFSVYRPTSEISRINNGDLHLLDASKEVLDVMDACTWLEHISEGAFSIRQHQLAKINPTGFVKGWAAEYSSRIFGDQGLHHWYLGIGGDFVLHGGMTPTRPWVIGITDPRDAQMLTGEVSIISGAVATSGTAQRGNHIWDARGLPVKSPFLSVTVTGPTLTWADAFATAVFVMGEPGLAWLQQFEGYEAVVV